MTCLDPRCVPETYFGPRIRGGVVRNAGGRATDDAIRSFTVLRALAGLKTIAVVHHTGMCSRWLPDIPVHEIDKRADRGTQTAA